MRSIRSLCFGIGAVILLSTHTVYAAPPERDRRSLASAQEDFASAQKLFDQKMYAEALVLFERAYHATKSPNAHLMMARCLLATGKTADAYEALSATAREATQRAETESKYAQTRDSAAAQLILLERRIGKIIVAFAELLPGVSVKLNGVPLSTERFGVPVAVEPGKMVLTAEGPEGQTLRREFDVGAGETRTVALSFEKASDPKETSQDAPKIAADEEAASQGGDLRVVGFATAGLGALGMVVFGVAGAMAESKFATIKEECGYERCTDPKYGPMIDSGKRMDTVANIGLIVGITGILGGGALILLGGPSGGPRSRASLAISPKSVGIHYAGSF